MRESWQGFPPDIHIGDAGPDWLDKADMDSTIYYWAFKNGR